MSACEIYKGITVTSNKLRLYCLRLSDGVLIVGNGATVRFWHDCGAARVTLSPELTLAQVKKLVAESPLPLECVVDGLQELMITKFCALGSYLSARPKNSAGKENEGVYANTYACGTPCRHGDYFLKDRKGILCPIVTDQFCQMHILNGKRLAMVEHIGELIDGNAGLRWLRIDSRYDDPLTTKRRVCLYKRALGGETAIGDAPGADITRGHYFRGVE